MTTGITTSSQDAFSRIDELLAHARQAVGAKRSALDNVGPQDAPPAPVAETPLHAAEADHTYRSVMHQLSAPSGNVHRALDPERVARLLDL